MRQTMMILSAAAMLLGFLNIGVTLANGGGVGAIGVWLGVILVLMGGFRLYLLTRSTS